MNYKVFVLGPSKSGKTTFAKCFPKLKHIEASTPYRKAFEQERPEISTDSPLWRDEITKFGIHKKLAMPDFCINYVKGEIEKTRFESQIISGIRNPRDFVSLFDYTMDYVVYLQPATTGYSSFDSGLDVIRNYIDWLHVNGLYKKDEKMFYLYPYVDQKTTLYEAVQNLAKEFLITENEFFKMP